LCPLGPVSAARVEWELGFGRKVRVREHRGRDMVSILNRVRTGDKAQVRVRVRV